MLSNYYFTYEGEDIEGDMILEYDVIRAKDATEAEEKAQNKAYLILSQFGGGYIDIYDNLTDMYIGGVEV